MCCVRAENTSALPVCKGPSPAVSIPCARHTPPICRRSNSSINTEPTGCAVGHRVCEPRGESGPAPGQATTENSKQQSSPLSCFPLSITHPQDAPPTRKTGTRRTWAKEDRASPQHAQAGLLPRSVDSVCSAKVVHDKDGVNKSKHAATAVEASLHIASPEGNEQSSGELGWVPLGFVSTSIVG